MKAESNIKPSKFEIENIQNDRCDVVLYSNIQEVVEEENVKYTFELHRLNICHNNNIAEEIEKDFDRYLKTAKDNEYKVLASEVRAKRDELLKETDKEMCIDRIGLDIPEDITATNLLIVVVKVFRALRDILIGNNAKYRQQLRDITKQEGFPYNIIWPNKEDLK